MKMQLRFKGDWKGLRQLPHVLEDAADYASGKLAREAANEMKAQLGSNKTNTTTDLAGSVQIKKNKHASYSVGPTKQYAYFVEHGRSPGKAAPFEAIENWMKSKNGINFRGQELERIAKFIAFKIGRDGVKAKPFVKPVVEGKDWQADYQRHFKAGLARRVST